MYELVSYQSRVLVVLMYEIIEDLFSYTIQERGNIIMVGVWWVS